MQNSITIRQRRPNPQGKGCTPVLQDWAALRPHLPVSKTPDDILRDYCLSALVLAARFRFRPVPGKPYHLYCEEGAWSLSLIGPREWGERMPGEFVAQCRLRDDMTWQLAFDQLRADSAAAQCLQQFAEGFARAVAAPDALQDGLPFYARELPYFQRMLGTGLAVSLRHSIRQSGAAGLQRALPALLPLRL